MKAAVIGGAGFLGKHLCAQLAACGDAVTAMDMFEPPAMPGGTGFSTLDVIRDPIDFAPGTNVVFYLSQSPHYREFPNKAEDLFGVNCYGAVRAAQAAVEAGIRVFIYASTGTVYQPSFGPLSEEAPLNRQNPYALSKIAAEEALALFADRMSLVCGRIFSIFGPEQKGVLPAVLAERVGKGLPVTLQPRAGASGDDGGLCISFLYVSDLARMLIDLARKALAGEKLPRILNLGGPEAIDLKSFAGELGRVLGKEPVLAEAPGERPGDLISDNRLLGKVLAPEFTPFSLAMEKSFGKKP